MLGNLAPARRRLVLGALALLLAIGLAVVVVAVVSREPAAEPVTQDEQGPVLLVPGYGGSTGSLEVLGSALEGTGRDVIVVRPPGDGRGDLRAQAEHLDEVADDAIDAGAPSVDVVGYSAGGVVVRVWVGELGGGSSARRIVTLASPHHGTDLATLASDLAPDACPEACRQLASDSALLRRLNAGDETPPGPVWVALWTTDDSTVVPPDSGDLDGALSYSVQSVCDGLTVAHADVPRTPAVIAMVEDALAVATPTLPDSRVC